MTERGEPHDQGNAVKSRDATSLSDLGLDKHVSSRFHLDARAGGAAYYLWAIRRTGARCNDSGAR